VVKAQGRPLLLQTRKDWLHAFAGGMLNIVGFSVLSSFALLLADTSRVAILCYTMPIWAALIAWPVLGEKLTAAGWLALALCIAGLGVLIYPLVAGGVPAGVLIALATAVSWGAGTVYIKWAKIKADPVAVAAWQLITGLVFALICLPLVEGPLRLSHAHGPALFGMIWTGLVGSGLAYFLWFKIVGRLPAATASLGILSVPVIGVISTALLLGERPTVPDMAGFALIFAASACVMLPSRQAPPPEPT
jgi:drug/metabolite transporter (DMT)-like permease